MIDILSVTIYIFTVLIFYVIFIDIILSWLPLVGIKFRPKFIGDILDPLYSFIKNIVPTTIGPMDLTPMVLILFLYFIRGIIIILNPNVQNVISNYIK